jgi:hypothetical protein
LKIQKEDKDMGLCSAEKTLKMGMGVLDTFKGNVLASTLTGVGIGWLLATGMNGGNKVEALKEKITDILEGKDITAKKKMVDVISEEVKEHARDFGDQVANWAREFGTSAQEQFKRASEGVKEMASERPVALAAASAAIAAAVGFGLWQILREKD